MLRFFFAFLSTRSAQLRLVKPCSFIGNTFPGYTYLFFSLLTLLLCKSVLFLLFLSPVLCLMNSPTIPSSCFLPAMFASWKFSFLNYIECFCGTATEVQSSRWCSHNNTLSPMPRMLGTLVPRQCIDGLFTSFPWRALGFSSSCGWLTVAGNSDRPQPLHLAYSELLTTND